MFAEYFILWSRQLAHLGSTTACTLWSSLSEENVQNMLNYTQTCWNWAIWAYGWAEYIFGPSVIFFILVFLCSTGLIYPVKWFFYGIWIAVCLVAGKIWELLQYMLENRSGIVKWLATQANKVSAPATINDTDAQLVVKPPVVTPAVEPPVVTPVVEPKGNRAITRQQTQKSQSGVPSQTNITGANAMLGQVARFKPNKVK